jgi:DNA polymerase-3 subunit beta
MADPISLSARVRSSDLETALKDAQTCVSPRASIPVLAYVLLETQGNELAIRSTDMNRAIRVTIPCAVDVPGSIALRARKFFDIVASLPKGEIQLETRGNAFTAISIAGLKASMPGLLGSKFPTAFPPCTDWKARFEPGTLSGLIRHVLPSLGEDNEEAGLTIGSALMRLTPAGILMVATDTYRLSRVEYRDSTASPEDWEILLPRHLLKTLMSLFPAIGKAPVDLGISGEAVYFRGANYLLAARRVPGSYPSFESVIPTWQYEAVVPTRDFYDAIDRVKSFDDSSLSVIRFDLQGRNLELRAQTKGVYEGVEQLTVDWKGGDIRFCLRAQYLMSCLPHLRKSPNVLIGIPDSVAAKKGVPIALTAQEGDPYNSLYLLMPTAVSRGTNERN